MDVEFSTSIIFLLKEDNVMKYNGLIISDIHIGAMPVEQIKEELENTFLAYIKNAYKSKSLDYIIFLGDYFDHKLYLNDQSSKYASRFISDLLTITDSINPQCKIRFVYGTESHESDQYDTLFNTVSNHDIKVIKHVEEELLFPTMKVLYIPEEYVSDKYEYYKEFFNENNEYTYIFGHGVIREVMKEAAVISDNQKDSKRRKPAVFSTAELRNISKQSYFGHYHMNIDNGMGFHYVGSFSRWKFGEDEQKGFYSVTYNDDSESYSEEFIINELAKKYKTISFGYKTNFDDMQKINEKISNLFNSVHNGAYDHIKLRFNIPDTCENPESIINYINELNKQDENVKVEITHGYIESKKTHDKKAIENDNNKYHMIFDKNIPIEEKVSHFISIEYNKEIAKEDVDKYLHNPLDEILK